MYYELNVKATNLAMIKKGYSINQLSKFSGVSKATLSRTLNKETSATPKTIYKIAQALDVEIEDLLIEIK